MNGDLFVDMPEKQTAAFPEPHPFQAAAHQKLRAGFASGHRKQLLVAPTGAGKTFCALRIVRETLLKGHRAVFVCDRTALINQTSTVADSYGLTEHGIIQADHWRRNNTLPFQIASVQTLQARGYWPDADVYILDECFPASTKILMQDGSSRPIEQVNSGDQILSAIGPDVVESVFCKSAAALVRVRLSDGTEFSCTPDHPVFTDIGWTAAGKLEKRQRLFGVQALRALWEGVQAKTDALAAQSSGSRVSVLDPQILREILLMECAQPDEVGAIHPQDARDACAHRASAEDAGWQRQATTADTAEDAGRSRRRMGDGIYRADAHGAPQWLSYALQDRSGAQGFANRIGARWLQSLRAIETSTGRTEGRVTPQVRVESVALEECRGGTLVYNLRVRRHPSYFANGILVHNCHTLYSTTRELLGRENATVIGLTATPCTKGLGLLYSNMINAATMHELTQSGVLVPMDILTCVKPDMTGAKTAGGEWTAKAAGEREAQIIGDVVGEWQRHGENRKTIAFGADIAYCTALVQRFNTAGINAAMYTAETPDHERTALLAEFEKPDPAIRILVSVEALAKGFDLRDIGCVIDARPLRKSLSTAIQMWGRGLRASKETGKENCRLLDFSGNIQRFYDDFTDVYFSGFSHLSEAEKQDSKPREEAEFTPTGCPQCHHKPFRRRCLACGFEKPTQALEDTAAGEMREIKIGKVTAASSEQDMWAQLCTHARRTSAKAPGRAWHLYQDIVGKKPTGLTPFNETPDVEVHPATLRKIKSLRIAWIKGKQATHP